ncbi:hypothetical protein Mapa_001875 [Marchantia paleacea]|nr:hypothetical protein Mapa_001875 [Marchantia paleacea]
MTVNSDDEVANEDKNSNSADHSGSVQPTFVSDLLLLEFTLHLEILVVGIQHLHVRPALGTIQSLVQNGQTVLAVHVGTSHVLQLHAQLGQPQSGVHGLPDVQVGKPALHHNVALHGAAQGIPGGREDGSKSDEEVLVAGPVSQASQRPPAREIGHLLRLLVDQDPAHSHVVPQGLPKLAILPFLLYRRDRWQPIGDQHGSLGLVAPLVLLLRGLQQIDAEGTIGEPSKEIVGSGNSLDCPRENGLAVIHHIDNRDEIGGRKVRWLLALDVVFVVPPRLAVLHPVIVLVPDHGLLPVEDQGVAFRVQLSESTHF